MSSKGALSLDSTTIIASDLVAKHAERLIVELGELGEFGALSRLKFALDTYALCRARQIMAEDPQCMQLDEPAPETQRSGVQT